MVAAIGEEEEQEEVRVGSILWVRRNNGIWWPGRVMAPTDTSLSVHQFSLTANRAKIKLLGQDNASEDWYNLERSRRIKSFRCGEFDDCIRKAESSKALASTKNMKHASRENAILHALELERQVVQKKLKRPGSEAQQDSCARAKRIKRVYFSLESRDCLEQSVQSRSSKGSPNFHAASESTSEPMESDSSKSENKVQTRNSKALSDFCVKRHKNMNGKSQGAISDTSESSVDDKTVGHTTLRKCKLKRKLSIQQLGSRPVGPDDDKSCVLDYLGEKNNYHFGNTKETTLIDVHIEVQASYKGVHVPLVSMMSRINGQAIIGHPVNIEVLEGSVETRVLKKNLGEKLFKSNMSRTCHLVWKTSKRTPVLYAPPRMQNAMKYGASKGKSVDYCIPVNHIFSKLLVAVSKA